METAKCEIQQTNLWLGGAGGTSRLHHDYADNMYVMLRGSVLSLLAGMYCSRAKNTLNCTALLMRQTYTHKAGSRTSLQMGCACIQLQHATQRTVDGAAGDFSRAERQPIGLGDAKLQPRQTGRPSRGPTLRAETTQFTQLREDQDWPLLAQAQEVNVSLDPHQVLFIPVGLPGCGLPSHNCPLTAAARPVGFTKWTLSGQAKVVESKQMVKVQCTTTWQLIIGSSQLFLLTIQN